MRVLMTGATGFIGAHLCRTLVASGHEVLALVRSPEKAARELPRQGVTMLAGDLTLFEQPDLVLPPCETVIHLAGVVSADTVEQYDLVNHQAVRSLVEALTRQTWRPRRLLFASSLAAAGPSLTRIPKLESDPAEPIDAYGRAKLKAEQYLAASAPFATTSFRPCMVFGPRDPASFTLFKTAKHGLGFRVAGAPQGLSYIDVDDVVSAVVAMMGDTSDAHRVYFLAAREQTDSQLLWQAMAKAVGRPVRVLRVPRGLLRGASVLSTALSSRLGFVNQLDAKQYEQMVAPAFVCSSEALQKAHDWTPRVSLVQSLSKAWAGYRADGWL